MLKLSGVSLLLSFSESIRDKVRACLALGVKGTVVSDPHSAQIALVSGRSRLSETMVALRLALLAVFRVVLKLFVVKELLLTRRKHKLGSAVDALQLFVNKIHTTPRKSANE